jgi:HEPN domain-containing protein
MKVSTQNWIEFVKRDLLAAQKLAREKTLQNVVVFHCQQAIEKAFKAILEELEEDIPRIHSTVTLYGKLPETIKCRLQYDIDELRRIDEVYIDSRYPADIGLLPDGFPAQEETQQMLDLAKKVVNQCLAILEEEATGDEEIISPLEHSCTEEKIMDEQVDEIATSYTPRPKRNNL